MNQDRPYDVVLMTAGSVYTLVLHYAVILWAWLPGALTVFYILVKIYYKIKRERLFWKERKLRTLWEQNNESDL